MTKQKRVVVGNGMAGARLVEEVLNKGGGDKFEISVFGDEPHGNYNRILLSGVLSGTHSEDNIFINPLEWYEKNNVKLFAGVRAIGVDRKAQTLYAAGGHRVPYDKLVIATGSVPLCRRWTGSTKTTAPFGPASSSSVPSTIACR